MKKNKENYEAKNRFYVGVLGMIPMGIMAGPIGAICSFVTGIFGANLSNKNAYNDEKNNYKYVANYDKIHQHKMAYDKITLLQNEGDKYANMKKEDVDNYLLNIRKQYPMFKECYDGIYMTENDYSPSIDCHCHKTTKELCINNNECTEKDYEYYVMGCYPQDIIRELDTAINSGKEIEWIKMTYKKYKITTYKGRRETYYIPKEFYIYRVKDGDSLTWRFPDYYYLKS